MEDKVDKLLAVASANSRTLSDNKDAMSSMIPPSMKMLISDTNTDDIMKLVDDLIEEDKGRNVFDFVEDSAGSVLSRITNTLPSSMSVAIKELKKACKSLAITAQQENINIHKIQQITEERVAEIGPNGEWNQLQSVLDNTIRDVTFYTNASQLLKEIKNMQKSLDIIQSFQNASSYASNNIERMATKIETDLEL